jgi:hypothetical protein
MQFTLENLLRSQVKAGQKAVERVEYQIRRNRAFNKYAKNKGLLDDEFNELVKLRNRARAFLINSKLVLQAFLQPRLPGV